jgi:hypothetical protein
MAASAGQIFNTESTRIEEILSKQIDTILPTLDPIWRDTVVTSQGVGPVSEFSKDLQVNKLYRTGMTGVIEQAGPAEDFVLYGDANNADGGIGDRLYRSNTGTMKEFPDPADGAKAKTFRLTVPMRAMYTNLMLTLGEMQMDATPAVIGDVIAPTLQGFAQNLSHTLCNYWYVSQNTTYRLGRIASVSKAAGNPTRWTITVDEEAYDRFFPGQRVDVYNGNTRRNEGSSGTAGIREALFVERVDDLAGNVVLIGPADTTGTISVDDDIVYANSGELGTGANAGNPTFTGIAGANSWIKATGNLLGTEAISGGTIDVATNPEFKSFVKDNVGTLTESKLRQYIRRFHSAKQKLGQTIDTLVASDGVWLSYESQKIGQYMIDRTNNLSNLSNEGSGEGFGFTFEGRTYRGFTSNYVSKGEVYGWKTSGNNWKRYVPADYAGLQNMGEADSYVPFRFVVPALTGGSSVKFPYTNGGKGLTEAVQMPGMLRMQLVPDQAAGLKLGGVTTEKEFGGSSNVG